MKLKVLVIGGTGRLGKHIVTASVTAGHSTFVLTRSTSPSNPDRAAVLQTFREIGVEILQGSLDDRQSLVNGLKRVEVVISCVAGLAISKQVALLQAIKEAGTIKRFIPSEFGMDVERVKILPKLRPYLGPKIELRRAIEACGVPYTIVVNVSFAKTFLASMWQLGRQSPPKDKVEIWGDGDGKVSFVDEDDIGAYTIKAIGDPRTINKTLSIRPQLISPNEVVAIWEQKIGHTLEKIYIPEGDLLKQIAGIVPGQKPTASGHPPLEATLCIRHAIFIEAANSVEASENYVEASELYPDYKFVTVEEYLDRFVGA